MRGDEAQDVQTSALIDRVTEKGIPERKAVKIQFEQVEFEVVVEMGSILCY